MKMNFLQQNRRRGRGGQNSVRVVIGLLVVIIFFFTINTLSLGSMSRILHSVGDPLWKGEASIVSGFSSFFSIFADKRALQEQNRALEEEVVALKLQTLSETVLRQENEELRALLNREDTTERIAAAILTRPNRTPYDTFIVDVGRKEGVSTDVRVFGPGGIVVGTVIEVYADTALISLYSTPGRVTEVVFGDDALTTEAVGRGGGDFEIRVPRGVEVTEGSPVYSPNLDGGILGVVEEVISLPADPFQTVLFDLPVNFQTLRLVLIEL